MRQTIFRPLLKNAVLLLLFIAAQVGISRAAEQPGSAELQYVESQGIVIANDNWALQLGPGESVEKVLVKNGDRVKTGQILAEIRNPALTEQLSRLLVQQQELTISNNELKLLQMERGFKERKSRKLSKEITQETALLNQLPEFRRDQRLSDLESRRDDLQDEMEILAARIDMLSALGQNRKNSVHLVDQQIARLQDEVNALSVRAPFDGEIARCSRLPGRIPAGAVVLEVWSLTPMRIRAQVLQHQINFIAAGCQALVSLDFSKTAPATAQVVDVDTSGAADEKDTYPTFSVILAAKDNPSWLRPGMKVSLRINTHQ